jgi:hypothetical protein
MPGYLAYFHKNYHVYITFTKGARRKESGRKIEMKRPNEIFERKGAEARASLYNISIVTVDYLIRSQFVFCLIFTKKNYVSTFTI